MPEFHKKGVIIKTMNVRLKYVLPSRWNDQIRNCIKKSLYFQMCVDF